MIAVSWFCPFCEWSAVSMRARSCPRCDTPMAVDPMVAFDDVQSGEDVTTHPFHVQRVHNMALDMQASEPRWFWWPYPDLASSPGSYMDVNVGYTEPAPPIPITFAGIPIIFNEDCRPGTWYAMATPERRERTWKDIFGEFVGQPAGTFQGVPMTKARLDHPTIHESESRVSIELGGISDAQFRQYKDELRKRTESIARAMGLDRYKLFDDPVPEGFRSPLSPLEAAKEDRWALPGL